MTTQTTVTNQITVPVKRGNTGNTAHSILPLWVKHYFCLGPDLFKVTLLAQQFPIPASQSGARLPKASLANYGRSIELYW